MLVSVAFPAGARFGGMPGLPGGGPGGVLGGEGFGRPPAAPPPACQQLIALRDETQKHGLAIQKANERKASVQEACRLLPRRRDEIHKRDRGARPDVRRSSGVAKADK